MATVMRRAAMQLRGRRVSSMPAVQRRSASTVQDAANKVKDAAASMAPAHHKPSSDVPWMVGSVLVFAPTILWLSSPGSDSKKHDHPPPKEKFKPKLRLPEPDSEHFKPPPEAGNKAGEGVPHQDGDHALRAKQEEHDHMIEKQKPGYDTPTNASNHAKESGLKSAGPEKFQAAAKIAQQANQQGGGEAARDSRAATHAAKAAREEAQNPDKETSTGFGSAEAPESAGTKMSEQLTQKQEENATEEGDKEDISVQNKDEQQ